MAKYALPTYSHSGKLRPLTLALVLGGIVAGALLAWLYQSLLRWIPFIYVNLLVVVGFGGLLAVAGHQAVKLGHCRNRLVAYALALPLAAGPLFASYWWDWQHTVATIMEKRPDVPKELVTSQYTLGVFLKDKREVGWKLKGSTFNGGGVTLVWVVEGLAILGITLFGVHAAVAKPYCERCGEWVEDHAFRVWGVTAEQVDPLLKAGELGQVAEIPGDPNADPSTSLTITVESCPKCRETGFLTVAETRIVGKKNKQEEKSKALVSHAVLKPEQLQRARDRAVSVLGQKLATG